MKKQSTADTKQNIFLQPKKKRVMIKINYHNSLGFNLFGGEHNLLKKVTGNFTFGEHTERLTSSQAAYVISSYLALLDTPKDKLYKELDRVTKQVLTDYPYGVTAKNSATEFNLTLRHETKWGNEQLVFSMVPGLTSKLGFDEVMIEEGEASGAGIKVLKDLAAIQQAHGRVFNPLGEQLASL
jgi:hypothetical protein